MEKKEIKNIFMERYSCKSFDATKKISQEDFEFLVDIGILSQTSFGLEPYKIVVL